MIPHEIRKQYATYDPEAMLFLDTFDAPPGAHCLEVGAHDAPLATMLCQSGYRVTSIDLRPYDGPPHPDHRHYVGDFGRLDASLAERWLGSFDAVYCVSALEHFGLGAYGERAYPYLDVIAARRMYDVLKLGGLAFVVVPVGGRHCLVEGQWRVYDMETSRDRIVQDFEVISLSVALTQQLTERDGRIIPAGSRITELYMQGNINGFPGIGGLFKLRKGK